MKAEKILCNRLCWSTCKLLSSLFGALDFMIWDFEIPGFGNFSTENISLIKKFKVKYFHGYMTSSKYFNLEYILLPIIHAN